MAFLITVMFFVFTKGRIMGKRKIPIIICLILILSLVGYLIFGKGKSNQSIRPVNTDKGLVSASTVSSGAISKDNSNNNTYNPPSLEYDDNNNNKEEDQMSKDPKNQWIPATEMDLDPSSVTVYVNKEYCLPKDYVPENLVVPNITFDTAGISERKLMREDAAKAIELLFDAALDEGYTLYGISGYRSYNRQKEIFLNNIVNKGKKHTLSYSAAPGTSEHQTGLAMDVSAKSIRYRLIDAFANCKEGKWLAEHAYEYGFIIRYPKDRSDITGYAYEPWHIRYVGKDLANYLYTNKLTLDEYYSYVPSEDFDYEEKYASLINYVPPATPTPTPTPTPIVGIDLDGDGIPDVFVGDDLDGDGIPDVVLGENLDDDSIPEAVFREDFDWESFFGIDKELDKDLDEDSEEDDTLDEDSDDDNNTVDDSDEANIFDKDVNTDEDTDEDIDEDYRADDYNKDIDNSLDKESSKESFFDKDPNKDNVSYENPDEDNVPNTTPVNPEDDYIN